MKASELRIGNLIEWEDDSHDIVRVTGILGYEDLDKADVVHYKEANRDEDGAAMLFEFIPIPLTEEWLKKFGFKDETKPWYSAKYFEFKGLNHTQWGVWMDDVALYRNETYMFKVEYVHQIQNLYFALTGEELTIKE